MTRVLVVYAAGSACVAGGAGLVYLPAGIVLLGVALLWAAYSLIDIGDR